MLQLQRNTQKDSFPYPHSGLDNSTTRNKFFPNFIFQIKSQYIIRDSKNSRIATSRLYLQNSKTVISLDR